MPDRYLQVDLNELQKGKTENSEMGRLRKKLCERLCVSESELIDILRQVRIKDGQESMESLKEILTREFSHYGLQPWTDSIDTLPYCDLVRAWNRSGINMVNVEDIRNYFLRYNKFTIFRFIGIISFPIHAAVQCFLHRNHFYPGFWTLELIL